MSHPSPGTILDRVPELATGYRLRRGPGGETSLLAPEALLKLSGTGAEILLLCDGKRSVRQVAAALREKYESGADRIEQEVIAFLESLRKRGAVHLK